MTSVLMCAFQLRKIIQYHFIQFQILMFSSSISNMFSGLVTIPIVFRPYFFAFHFAWHRDNHNFVTVLLIPFLASIGYALHLRRAAWFNKPCSIELGKGSVKQAIHALYDSCNKNVICAGNPVLIPVIFWIEFVLQIYQCFTYHPFENLFLGIYQ